MGPSGIQPFSRLSRSCLCVIMRARKVVNQNRLCGRQAQTRSEKHVELPVRGTLKVSLYVPGLQTRRAPRVWDQRFAELDTLPFVLQRRPDLYTSKRGFSRQAIFDT